MSKKQNKKKEQKKKAQMNIKEKRALKKLRKQAKRITEI
jgi:hypothetical protein